MPQPDALLLFVTAGLLLNITPGPDVLYIVGRSLAQGRSAGVLSALGIAAGCLVHVAAAALGLSAIMSAAPALYDGTQYAGAAYLVWIGLRAVRARGAALALREDGPAGRREIFRQGMVTNLLNPKVAIFFVAFLPQFTDATRGPLPPQLLVLGLIFVFNGLLVCLAYAVAAASLGAWLKAKPGTAGWLHRAMGALFIGLGVRLALGSR